LLGDNDFSARVPYALAGIAAIGLVSFAFRRYLGKTGAVIGGILFLISPYMLYYSRYTRNEVLGVLIVLLTIYAILRYLEKGDKFSLFLFVIATALDFTDKATAYIFTAQLLLFLLVLLVEAVQHLKWKREGQHSLFTFLTLVTIGLLLIALGFAVWNAALNKVNLDATPAAEVVTPQPMSIQTGGELIGLVLAILFGCAALVILVRGVGWKQIRSQRSFDLIILTGALILPLVAPIPVKLLGWDPLDYTALGIQRTGIFLILLTALSLVVGLWWKPRLYPVMFAIFYAIFTVFYTSFFTNGFGFFKGLVGALGYWMAQQAVNRGTQPLYYYILVHLPIYEYLAVMGSTLALYFGIRHRKFTLLAGQNPAFQSSLSSDHHSGLESQAELPFEDVSPVDELAIPEGMDDLDLEYHYRLISQDDEILAVMQQPGLTGEDEEVVNGDSPNRRKTLAKILGFSAQDLAATVPENPVQKPVPVLGFLLFWAATSTVAFSLAGERMPWLTTHIAVGFLLAAAWGLGYLVDIIPWKKVFTLRGIVALLLLPVVVSSFSSVVGILAGANPPFQGTSLDQLRVTSTFLLGLVGFLLSAWGVLRMLAGWPVRQISQLLTLVVFGFMAFLTARTAFTASYINYDNATEFVVYAHSARGPKDILEQVEEISRRTTKGKDVMVAYVGDALYPYWWYFRDYPNKRWFSDNPTRELASYPLIIVDEANFARMETIVRNDYVSYEYMRMWWPMQDYWNLTWERIWNAIRDPKMRAALYQIWLNRDYTRYSEVTGNNSLTLTTWSPAAKLRLYIRKDVVASIWNYGSSPVIEQEVETDPYLESIKNVKPEKMIGGTGSTAGLFQAPRGVALAPDGTLYVADSRNHRIQHLSAAGEVLNIWGTFADVASGDAPGGTMNEPWSVAVDSQGNVYVADTWNHRIQKFSPDGQFIKMWGTFGQADTTTGMWGPRGLAFDEKDRLFVTDTGNKRVLIFDVDGNYLSQFGSVGMDAGQFDEPVGLAINSLGQVVIADTWNQRVQVFTPDDSGLYYYPTSSWEISGWYSQSLENKPFLALDSSGNVYVSDPEGIRVLVFDSQGVFLYGWGDYNLDVEGFSLPIGLTVDADGGVWVSDAGANRVVYFRLP
jgi:DNA-binding beta-propeller fold protein YncE